MISDEGVRKTVKLEESAGRGIAFTELKWTLF